MDFYQRCCANNGGAIIFPWLCYIGNGCVCAWEILEMEPEGVLWCCAYNNIVLDLIVTYFDLVVAVEDFGIHGWDVGEERKERKERNAIIYRYM